MDPLLLLKALILGIVEGLTEFLPVSSTGHLIIVGSLLGYTDEQSKVFKIVVQLGAILAVCWDFRERIGKALGGLGSDPVQQRFAGLLVVGFLPAAVLGLLFHSAIKTHLFNPLTVAAALICGGFLILFIERKAYHPRVTSVEDMTWQDALKVGFAQAAAMFPGVSRSGATIMGGLIFGLSRKTATEFSFFLAIPTMFAATTYDVYKNWQLLRLADLPVFAVGFVASFVAAMLTVKALLRYVSHHDFTVFAWYRIAFGLLVLATWQLGWVEWAAR
ncbi:MAG: undecaprenyl-diphosphate phosphatase [Azonexus sp.]|nr:undecaprenyl-diphosphate phosphatase [Betaproteobacteria bacterium]MBK8919356.1 undecaprenyl-diphosphate phosphatase [Betaproteobacteria bacterium]MBP6035286.1 undecaprenyl-diphosphate phosphatase [Azonexus sp.]MBP6905869.1 undecaprenyl-diphosphate phosphatase [Azonexus sp.]